MLVKIHTDGACVPNPGPASIGWVIRNSAGKVIASNAENIGHATNNEAEHRAVFLALEAALKIGADDVEVYSDSTLIVNTLSLKWKSKNPRLTVLRDKTLSLARCFRTVTFTWVPREENEDADLLTKAALGIE